MSKQSKFFLGFSAIFFVGLCIFRIIYGGWHDSMWVPLGLSVALFVTAIVRDWRNFMDFFTMRTTKHGLNMGVLILLAVVGLSCVNLLAVRYNHKLDWTTEKLHTLSDQSVKAVQGLKRNTEIVLLYKPDEQPQGENVPRAVADLVSMYTNISNKITYKSYNAYEERALSEQYNYKFGPYAVYAVQGDGGTGSRVKIEQPTEEGVTRALLKLGRESKKIIYFTTGHGERGLDDTAAGGLSELKQGLAVIYEPKPLTLYQVQNKVPPDAGAVAIIGPQQAFLPGEIQGLRDYARAGGALLIAIDPDLKQNLALLTKSLGVEFNNDYVLDPRTVQLRRGATLVLGTTFAKNNEITRSVEDGKYAVFMVVSSLKKAPDLPPSLTVEPLVSSGDVTATDADLKNADQAHRPNGPHVLMMTVKGQLPAAGSSPPGKDFAAVVSGDSDFLSNTLIYNPVNHDLSLNLFSSLMQDKDLISIRPKQPAGTILDMSDMQFALYALCFLIALPLLMFAGGGYTWWRRRTA